MPRHKQFTTCRKSGGPVSKMCSCEHCSLAVCSVCGAGEGSLTTDCPGDKVDYDKQQEVFETNLEYTDDRGWHLAQTDDGTPIAKRSPRFESTKEQGVLGASTSVWPTPPRVDGRTVIAPSIDWAAVDRTMNLQHELTQKAIAWVIADRVCENRSATLARIEDETAPLRRKPELDANDRDLLGRLEQEKITFRSACMNAERCDLEFKQLARKIVDTLENSTIVGSLGGDHE